MRPVILLLIFIFLALLSGALLSFPLYELLNNFFDIRFNKLISHLSTISGLVFIFLYLRFYNVLNLETAGFAHSRRLISRDLLHGALIGIFIIVFLEIILLALDIRNPAPDLNFSLALLSLIASAIITGIIVGLIEETLYRGALLGGLLCKTGALTAVIISSLVYAAVHYIRFPAVAEDTVTSWATGFLILSESFNRFLDPAIIDSFLTLTAFGIFLALIRLNRGNIYQCIGVHAGVVMSVKIIHELTDYNPASDLGFLVNTHDHHLGYLALIWLLLLTVFYFIYGKRYNGLLKHPGRMVE
jgi:uncharacterized protein